MTSVLSGSASHSGVGTSFSPTPGVSAAGTTRVSMPHQIAPVSSTPWRLRQLLVTRVLCFKGGCCQQCVGPVVLPHLQRPPRLAAVPSQSGQHPTRSHCAGPSPQHAETAAADEGHPCNAAAQPSTPAARRARQSSTSATEAPKCTLGCFSYACRCPALSRACLAVLGVAYTVTVSGWIPLQQGKEQAANTPSHLSPGGTTQSI